MAEAGLFDGKRVELIDGTILEMSPQRDRHAKGILLAQYALMDAFGPEFTVRVQLPLRVGDRSEPEPDVAVVRGGVRSVDAHPTTAVLVVEVSDTTLEHDRRTKAHLYASARVDEYWIVNLIDGRVEVQREPITDAAAPFGHRYGRQDVAERDGMIAPVALPERSIAVADLLP